MSGRLRVVGVRSAEVRRADHLTPLLKLMMLLLLLGLMAVVVRRRHAEASVADAVVATVVVVPPSSGHGHSPTRRSRQTTNDKLAVTVLLGGRYSSPIACDRIGTLRLACLYRARVSDHRRPGRKIVHERHDGSKIKK